MVLMVFEDQIDRHVVAKRFAPDFGGALPVFIVGDKKDRRVVSFLNLKSRLGQFTVASSPFLTYVLGQACGLRLTISRFARATALNSVELTWQMPPPTSSISCAAVDRARFTVAPGDGAFTHRAVEAEGFARQQHRAVDRLASEADVVVAVVIRRGFGGKGGDQLEGVLSDPAW